MRYEMMVGTAGWRVRRCVAAAMVGFVALLVCGCGAVSERIESVVKQSGAQAGAVGEPILVLPTATPKIAASGTVTETQNFAIPIANQQPAVEVKTTLIDLTGPLTQRAAEVSGLAWLGDRLVIMPQYTNFADAGVHEWYTLTRAEIAAWLRSDGAEALTPVPLPVNTNGVPESIVGYEGLEALAFDQAGYVFVTAEATANAMTAAWLLRGVVAPDGMSVTLETPMSYIEPQSLDQNHSDESLVLTSNGLFTVYEGNGIEVNTEPVPLSHVFGRDLSAQGAVPFPHIEYRITDATQLDASGHFWAINYFFPDDSSLATLNDPIAAEWGEGPSHGRLPQVERLVEFAWLGDRIERIDSAPIQLELSLISRNWEGIVRFADGEDLNGFLIITDQFPDTLFAYVPMPEER